MLIPLLAPAPDTVHDPLLDVELKPLPAPVPNPLLAPGPALAFTPLHLPLTLV